MRYDTWLETQPQQTREEVEAAIDAYADTSTNPYSLDMSLRSLGHGDYEITVSDGGRLVDVFEDTDEFEKFMVYVATHGGQQEIDRRVDERRVEALARAASRAQKGLLAA